MDDMQHKITSVMKGVNPSYVYYMSMGVWFEAADVLWHPVQRNTEPSIIRSGLKKEFND